MGQGEAVLIAVGGSGCGQESGMLKQHWVPNGIMVFKQLEVKGSTFKLWYASVSMQYVKSLSTY